MMKWGMNVTVTEAEGDYKFLTACKNANIDSIKLRAKFTDGWLGRFDFLKLHKMKAYVSFFDFMNSETKTPSDDFFKGLVESYERYCKDVPKEVCLGIALPENVHLITRTQSNAKAGIRRDKVKSILKQIVSVIHKCDHLAVLPVRIDDIQGDVWKGVDPDRYDIETMFSRKMASMMKSETFESILSGKKYWLGKVGQLGGYIMPTHQVKFLRRVKEYAKGAEFAFLWSEKAVGRYSWSVNGEFIVDVMREEIKTMNYRRAMAGNPVIAEHHAKKRVAPVQPEGK